VAFFFFAQFFFFKLINPVMIYYDKAEAVLFVLKLKYEINYDIYFDQLS